MYQKLRTPPVNIFCHGPELDSGGNTAGATVPTFRIFISSPGDVFEERAIAQRVIERLQTEYVGRVVLKPVLWEHEPLVATGSFQEQIVRPSETDVVVSILWSRLGTRLPKGFARTDGSRFDSGTEFEFEDALAGFRRNGKPDLLVYRKTAPPSVRLDDEIELLERLRQKKMLDDFIARWFHDQAEGTLIAAFHAFEAPGDFEELLEKHLRRLIERRLPDALVAASDVPAIWKKGSPFRGLEAFEFEHAPVFFGRTKAVSDILAALRKQAAEHRAFVLILGMSGGGKSSVVRAGVLPMLTQPGVIEGVRLWRRAVFRPGDTPGDLFTGLAAALLRDYGLPSLDPEGEGPAALACVLRESPHAAVQLIRSALALEADAAGAAQSRANKADARLALVIDQMEELFTHDGISAEDRKDFADTVDALARSGRVWIIATLRSDFYPRLAELPVLGELKDGCGQYDLMPPMRSEIGQMIRLPTRAAGLRFEEDPATSERLDDVLRDTASERPEILPLLQFTLEELYQRRTANGTLTLEAYRALGGVEGSLAQRAESVFRQLAPEVQAALPTVLSALVSVEQDGHDAVGRKRAPWTIAESREVRVLLERFVAARLFVTELADDGSVVVSVAHEALLWHWPRVQEWLELNRSNLRIRSRIASAAERWATEHQRSDLLLPRGRPLGEAETLLQHKVELNAIEMEFVRASIARSKRSRRLEAAVVVSLAILAAVAGSTAFFANQQRELAVQARTQAVIEAETARQITSFMVGLFSVSDPSGEARGNTVTAREILDQGADRIEAELAKQPAIQATLMETMGTVYTGLGLYPQATSLLESALDKRRALLGGHHREIARTLVHLGDVLTLNASYAQAESMYREALAMQRALLGEKHEDVARTLYALADVLGRKGEYGAAEPLFRQSLAMRREVSGPRTIEVAQSLEGLALNLFDQGNYDDPVALLRGAVAIRREQQGDPPHPDLADALNNLGFVLGELGEHVEAEALFREALEMKRKVLGDAHSEIAMGLNNVAFTLHDQGKHDDAEAMYREALAMQRELLSENHPAIAMSLNNLAFLLYEKGEREEAMQLSRESLDMYRRALGDEHPSVAQGMNNLAMWIAEAGDYATAEPMLREALALRIGLLGEDHVDVAGSLTLLADVLVHTGRYEEARALAERARLICTHALSEHHWRTAGAASVEGAALTGLRQYRTAETLLLQSLDILNADDGALPVFVADTRQRLADLYRLWGKPDEAARYLAMRDPKPN